MENEGAGMNGMVSMIVTPGGVIAIEPTPTAVVVKAFRDANIDFDVFVNGQPAGASSGSTGRMNRASAFLKNLVWALVIVAISCGLSWLPETTSDISASLPASFLKFLNLPDVPRGLIDVDAVACTTNRLDYLFAYKADPSSSTFFCVVDKTEHCSQGFGYLKVPDSSPQGFHMVHCHYMPSIPSTIISPGAIARTAACQVPAAIASLNGSDGSLTLSHCHGSCQNISFSLVRVDGLFYTHPHWKPTHDERRATSLPV